jgi:hypothetical protein
VNRRRLPAPKPAEAPTPMGGLGIDHPVDAQIVDTWTYHVTPVQYDAHHQAIDMLAVQLSWTPNVINDWEGGWSYGGQGGINYDVAHMGWQSADQQINTRINLASATPPPSRVSRVLKDFYELLRAGPAKPAGSS